MVKTLDAITTTVIKLDGRDKRLIKNKLKTNDVQLLEKRA